VERPRIPRRFAPLLALAGALALGAGVAAAEETDRVQVGVPGINSTRGFSPALFVTLTAPLEYQRADEGRWNGPRCEVPGRPDLSGDLFITWRVGFDDIRSTAAEAARAHMTFEWAVVGEGSVAVSHVVAGRTVGTLPGYFLLTDSRSEQGWHEGSIAFSLGKNARGRGVYATARFWGRGIPFRCTVVGTPVSQWQRTGVTSALQSVQLEGNLPPARVTVRARSGRVLGEVTDSFGHFLAGVGVKLERREGRRWRAVRSGVTDRDARYTLRAPGKGTYRVTASLAGVRARSNPVRL
jgi:hypothetical protein